MVPAIISEIDWNKCVIVTLDPAQPYSIKTKREREREKERERGERERDMHLFSHLEIEANT
jgi:hypothetical protein